MKAISMFPLSVTGKIDLPSSVGESIVHRLANALIGAEAVDVKVGKNYITFKGGMSYFEGSGKSPRRNLVGLFDRCEIHTSANKLEYVCSTKIAAIVVAVMSVIPAIIVIFGPPKRDLALEARLALSIGIWLWLFGMNYLTFSFKVRRFLKRAIYHE
jgi:hypothetical protein